MRWSLFLEQVVVSLKIIWQSWRRFKPPQRVFLVIMIIRIIILIDACRLLSCFKQLLSRIRLRQNLRNLLAIFANEDGFQCSLALFMTLPPPHKHVFTVILGRDHPFHSLSFIDSPLWWWCYCWRKKMMQMMLMVIMKKMFPAMLEKIWATSKRVFDGGNVFSVWNSGNTQFPVNLKKYDPKSFTKIHFWTCVQTVSGIPCCGGWHLFLQLWLHQVTCSTELLHSRETSGKHIAGHKTFTHSAEWMAKAWRM